MRLSIKLASLAAAAAFLPLFIAFLLVGSKVSGDAHRQASEQLRNDARVASAFYDKRLSELRSYAQTLATEIASRALVSSDSLDRNSATALARLQDMLPRAQNEASLDVVIVTDPLGRVIARHNDRPVAGETVLGAEDKNPVAEKVIITSQPVASCVIERGERYARFGLDRIAPVRMANGNSTEDALVIEAGAPVFSGGRIVGAVLIGQLLNTYYKPRSGGNSLLTPLIAEIRQALFGAEASESGALIASGGVIVASSIPPGEGNAPLLLGAAHDNVKNEEIFRQGDHSHNVAWQQIKAIDDSTVASIGVARPSTEFEGAAGGVRATMWIVMLFAVLLAGGGGFWFGMVLGQRLDDLSDAATRWGLGELSAVARDRKPVLARWIPEQYLVDELNRLARQLDEMRDSFRQAVERLRRRQ